MVLGQVSIHYQAKRTLNDMFTINCLKCFYYQKKILHKRSVPCDERTQPEEHDLGKRHYCRGRLRIKHLFAWQKRFLKKKKERRTVIHLKKTSDKKLLCEAPVFSGLDFRNPWNLENEGQR